MEKDSNIIESVTCETATDKLKIGEIFLLKDCSQIINCIQCWREFQHFTEFTLHIQEHYLLDKVVPLEQRVKVEIHADIEEVLVKVEAEEIDFENYDDLSQCYTENDIELSNPIENAIESQSVSDHAEEIDADLNTKENLVTDDSKNLTCDYCGWVSKQKRHLRSHIKTHSENRVACVVCGKKISTHNLKVHMKIHTNTPDFLCSTCGMRFINKGSLKLHLIVHNQDFKYNCDFCSAKFVRSDKLLNHIRKSHGTNLKFYCSTCNLGFMSKKSMIRHENGHLRTPDENVEFLCKICNEGFKDKDLLRAHKIKHLTRARLKKTTTRLKNTTRNTNANVYCSYCDSGFVHARSLLRHVKKQHPEMITKKTSVQRRKDLSTSSTSTKIKSPPIKAPCEVCGKEVYAHNMSQHVKIHTAKKDFVCSTCGKSFIINQLLVQHLVTHNQNYKYKCEFCPDKYLRYGQYLAHVRKLHGEAMKFHCSTCNMGFMHKVGLVTHEKKHLTD